MLELLERQQTLTGNQRRIVCAAILGDMLSKPSLPCFPPLRLIVSAGRRHDESRGRGINSVFSKGTPRVSPGQRYPVGNGTDIP